MKFSSQFSTYFWLSCLTILVAVAVKLTDVNDEAIFKFLKNLIDPKFDAVGNSVIEEKFTQRLDHYNRTEYDHTFKQNYFINSKYYDSEATEPVVLLVVSAMTHITSEILQEEDYVEFAQRTNALMLAVEPRFYGTSQYSSNLTVDDLYFLNTEQSLADLALFKEQIPDILRGEHNINIPEKAKWVATGKEYGGSYAAWFRLKYPHEVMAAVPIMAPLWVKPNHDEYFDRVEANIYSEKIESIVREAYMDIDMMLEQEESKNVLRPWNERKLDLDTLKDDFMLCVSLYSGGEEETNSTDAKKSESEPAVDSKDDGNDKAVKKVKGGVLIQKNVNFFRFTLTLHLAVISQATQFSAFREEAMRLFLDVQYKQLSSYDKFKNAIQLIVSKTKNSCLENDFDENVKRYQDTKVSNLYNIPEILFITLGNRNSFYQRCFEIGMFKSAAADNYFNKYVPLSYYTDFCACIYNPLMNQKGIESAIYTTNLFYGSLKYEGRKTLFINRKGDTFGPNEIKESKKSNEVVSIVLTDMPPSYEQSTPQDKSKMREYYIRIFKPLLRWVGNADAVAESNTYPQDEYIDEEGQNDNMDAVFKKNYETVRKEDELLNAMLAKQAAEKKAADKKAAENKVEENVAAQEDDTNLTAANSGVEEHDSSQS